MKNAFMWGVVVLGFLLVAATALSLTADPQKGKALVEKNCTRCHGSEVYTRPDRRVDSLDALRGQVEVCSQNAHTGWNDVKKADVVAYLNEAFYHFK